MRFFLHTTIDDIIAIMDEVMTTEEGRDMNNSTRHADTADVKW